MQKTSEDNGGGRRLPELPHPARTADSLDDALRWRRALATGLLVVMAAVWIATLLVDNPPFWVRLVRAMSEAGIVGGLADWFAVTALFRRPMGLPIPHTAIIPANQKRIAATLNTFIATNFITRELMLKKARELGLGRRVAAWLTSPATAPRLSAWLVAGLPTLIRALEAPELHRLLRRAVGEQLRGAEIAPTVAGLLRILATSREAEALITQVVTGAADYVERNKAQILDMVDQHSRWWIPRAVNRRFAKAVADGLLGLLQEMKRPDSEQRVSVTASLLRLADELATSPEFRARLEDVAARALEDKSFNAWLKSIWNGLTERATLEAGQLSSATREGLDRGIAHAAKVLASDPALLARVDTLAERIALVIVARRHDIAGIVDEVVRGWDPETMSARLERVVGSDLQFIRMNGTVVGAAVGGLLFLLAHALRPVT